MPLTDQEKISNILKSKTYFQDQNQNIIVTILNDITNDTGVVLNFSREDAGTL